MQIILVDNIWLYLDNMTPDVELLIENHFSALDPKSKYITDIEEQSWDGVYRRYYKSKQRLSRGFLDELLLLCHKHNVPVDIKDNRESSKYPMFTVDDIKDDILAGITLLPHQMHGLKSCIKHEVGIHNFITGSGKTELMCAIAKLLCCPTVIIAEERIVIDQIRERLELRDVTDDIGIFYAGKSPSNQLICVGSLQSVMSPAKLSRKSGDTPQKYEAKLKAFRTRRENTKIYKNLISKCELLMIDEADKACNSQYRNMIMKYCNARYRYGFTGTLPDQVEEPVQCLTLKELLGNVIAKCDRRYLENIGRIIPVKYIMIPFGIDGHHNNKAAFDVAVKKWLTDNSQFHHQVKQITDGFSQDNFLILVENIKLGKNLELAISGSKFIHGTTTVKARNKVLKEFANRELRILIGSKILKRGLDIKGGIDNIILCASSKKDADLEQKVGRALRVNERGWARVWDFLFVCNKYLYKHSRKRLKRMIQLGYPSVINTPHGAIDGQKILNSGFNLFRYLEK